MRKSGFVSILQYDERTLTRTRVKPGAGPVEVVSVDQQRGHWPATDGQLASALGAFVRQHEIAQDRVVTVLPRHLVTVRIITLPTHDPAEATRMIQFSAEEYVPYPAEELLIQDAILRREPGGESRVLAVLAHRDVLKAHLAPLRAAGMIPEKVLLSTACIANAIAAAKAPMESPHALAYLGAGCLEVLIFRNGKLQFCRGVASTQDWAAAGEAADEELSVEVRASLSTFRRESEDGEGADTVLLASDFALDLAPRAEALANETGRDCVVDATAAALAAPGGPAAGLAALGAAITLQGGAALEMNLLPAEESRARAMAGAVVLLRRAGLHAGIVAAALCLLFVQAWWQRASYIRELEQELKKVEPAARGLTEKQEQLAILRQQMKRGNSPLHMLAVAAEAAPPGKANVVQFRYGINEGVDIYGRAKEVDDVQAFASGLRKLSTDAQLAFFQHARTMYEDRGEERGTPVVLYHINVPVEVEAAEEGAAAASEGGAQP